MARASAKKAAQSTLFGAAGISERIAGAFGLILTVTGSGPWRVAGLALAGWWLFLFLKRRQTESQSSSALKDALERLAGSNPDSYQVFVPGGSTLLGKPSEQSGISINIPQRKILVGRGTVSKIYDFGDVREWSTERAEAERLVGFNLGGAASMQVGAHNLGAAIKANERSGIFIRVKDIDHPVWQISLTNQADLDRWTEILTRAFSEQQSS